MLHDLFLWSYVLFRIFCFFVVHVCFCAKTHCTCINYILKPRMTTIPVLLLLLRIASAIQNLLSFRVNFRVPLPISVIEIFIRIAQNLYIGFGRMVIFTILIPSIHDYKRTSRHLGSSVVFLQRFKHSLQWPFTLLGQVYFYFLNSL